jgi:hypothetical protein
VNDYPITVEQILTWLRCAEKRASGFGIITAGLRTNNLHVPSAAADFDTLLALGRVSVWASGEIDFEVLCRKDGAYVFFRHEMVSRMNEPVLEKALDGFFQSMLNAERLVTDH